MIIGIAGKAGSGKDLVGSIIQYLINSDQFNYKISEQNYNDYLKNKHDLKSYWKIVKFADKLKDIVCLLIGCTRQQLETREFKEKELGEEWDRIVGLDGKVYLPDDYPDLEYSKLTPRLLLQLLGTECGRDIIHPNCWVNATFADYKPIGDTLLEGEVRRVREEDLIYPNWIITDMRFPNELEAVKKHNGITIRINSGLVERTGKMIQGPEHISETALDNAKFDYIIENNGTIEELLNKVKKILINEKII